MRSLIGLSFAVAAVFASIASAPADQPCQASDECGDSQEECVLEDDDDEEGFCQAADTERDPSTCGDVSDCLRDEFPVEVRCDEGLCVCLPADMQCEFGYVLLREQCLCAESNGLEGAVCAENSDCTSDNTCVAGECAPSPVRGEACDDNRDCTDFDDTCINGACAAYSDADGNGGPCDDADDCRGLFTEYCVNGLCNERAGNAGDQCFDDAECLSNDCGFTNQCN